jgi:hypothetical protein
VDLVVNRNGKEIKLTATLEATPNQN